ncbi:DUF6268 family outer membrane beta-barrel protein [Altibacter sp. HG106]|uniref:DUF6268 family outer membrane beta-barrel protein n=1 Tax=Altibacter sp. HG106 TaxID=3023937 RepID=UPI0023508C76|nr:DUF6268 family outer membrane beta-barrel protein [Altibacter sp. HG106]MDC7995760.1 DUF6268 family outer membrane beta-barrel protein [Altibacter sp. HG106]
MSLVCCSVFSIANAQTTDIARVEYLYIPFSGSDNSLQRYRALVQAPIPIDRDTDQYFVVGLEYRFIDIDIENNLVLTQQQIDQVNTLHRIEGYLGYTFRLKEHWIMGVRAGARINSNLESSVISDDIIYTAAAYVIIDHKKDESVSKPWRLIMGLNYTSTPGRNFPLPLINYYREFHPDWTYTVGVPKMNLRRYLNTSHKDALQAFVTLDNFFANIQNNFFVNGNPNTPAQNISMTNVLAGLGYEHYFTDHLLYYGYLAHTLHNEFRLRDDTRETAYVIDNGNSFYFRTGIKFKF